MTRQKILVIEDDRKVAELVRLYLERDGFHPIITYDGLGGLDLARQEQPDLIVLDLMLPTMNGLDICRILRSDKNIPDMPIIMLTARSTEDDKLAGIELGADDYITKPFSPRELVARIKMVLRRMGDGTGNAGNSLPMIAGELQVDITRHEVTLSGQNINLTPKEFKLLKTMMAAPGRVFSRDDLMNHAFGYDYDGLARTVDVHIMKLRKKIEADITNPTYIHTVYGIGYKFESNFE